MKSNQSEVVLAECERCKQALRIVRENGCEVAWDQVSDKQHVCWDLPEDACLLVLDD